MNYKILLIEDDEGLNRGISYKLSKEGHEVYNAATLEEAQIFFKKESFDLIICDINLPDGNGLNFCKEVRKTSKVLFLFLTAMDTEMDIVQGYDVGADDYITKPFSMLVLTSKVNAILGRVPSKTQNTLQSGEVILYLNEGHADKNGIDLSLTPNEWKLLCLFMENPRKVFSKRKLLDALWQTDSDYLDENNVAVNIRRLREKIEDDPSDPHYIKNVRGIGYIWSKECEKA